jgi:hypothetical protein
MDCLDCIGILYSDSEFMDPTGILILAPCILNTDQLVPGTGSYITAAEVFDECIE